MAKKLPLSEQSLEEQFGKRFVKTINALKKKVTQNMYLQHATLVQEHFLEGTQRLEEPVSKTTLNSCGGVPIVIGP
jgi:hypothetical protein